MFLKTNSCTVYYKQLMMANVMFCCCNSSKALKPQTLHFLYNHQSIIGDRFRRLLLLLFHHNKCSKLIKKKTPKCSHYCFSSPTERFLWNSAAPMDRAVIGWLGNAEVVNRGLWLVRNRPVPPLPVCAAVMLGWDVKYAAVYKPVRVHVYNTCFYRWWSVDEWLMKQISARRKLGVVLLFRQL